MTEARAALMSRKSFAFVIVLFVALTAVICIPVTKYLYEPVERKVSYPVNYISLTSNDGYFLFVTGDIHYTEIFNRIGSFITKYNHYVEYDQIHRTDAHYIFQYMLDSLEYGGIIHSSGHFYLTDILEITHSYTTFRGGNYTYDASCGLRVMNVSYCEISYTSWFSPELNAYEEWMFTK